MSLPPRQRVDPLDWRTPITDPNTGNPTLQFVQIWQRLFGNLDLSVSDIVKINAALATKADKVTEIIAGIGLDGGGDLSADRTIDLADTAVTPGAYTSANITVDQQGRITAAANGSGGGGALEVQDEGVTEEAAATVLNFTGAGVTVTGDGLGTATIDIPGGGGGGIPEAPVDGILYGRKDAAWEIAPDPPALKYIYGFFFTEIPAVNEYLMIHPVTLAHILPANFGGFESSIGVNPTASFVITIAQNGSTIGTLTVSTGGVVTAATTGGTSKAVAVGDIITARAPSPNDATAANMGFTLMGDQ